MLDQKLQQRLLQKLSPQQIQLIKLLEIPTMELEQRIKKEIEENPLLEVTDESDEQVESIEKPADEEEQDKDEDEFSLQDYLDDDYVPSYKYNTGNYSKDDVKKEIPYSSGTTFYEFLSNQLGFRTLSEKERMLAEYMLGNIDEDGYLRRDINAMVDDVAFAQNLETDKKELEEILMIIQDLDPPGIGARTLQECLLLQIYRLQADKDNEEILLAKTILEKYFPEFTKKHYEKIALRLSLSDEELKPAIEAILKLNPKPGVGFGDSESKVIHHITPDFILDNIEGKQLLSLNSRNAPELRISEAYSDLIHEYSSNKENQSKQQKDAVVFVKQKLDAARWFIDAIKQRQNTLLSTMNAIIDFQREYFIEGNETKLRPMILKDIAEKTGLDISTISRVVNSKYIQTHFGIFSLKYFFSEGLQTETGEEASSREIKIILQECVGKEDKRKPLTDDKLAKILQQKGYHIARRTVAKYREQLNISVGRLRKEL
ncbi:MAG: RNA polymerase factor sigma-54 [Bacteroidia bacterium]|nr:RNA polymerase factor sigma-54 [Bacteroidia bacterium]